MHGRYVDKIEMDKLIQEVPPKHRFNYRLFELHADEKDTHRFERVKRRNLVNKEDPYYRKPSFSPDDRKVYQTTQMLEMFKNRNYVKDSIRNSN